MVCNASRYFECREASSFWMAVKECKVPQQCRGPWLRPTLHFKNGGPRIFGLRAQDKNVLVLQRSGKLHQAVVQLFLGLVVKGFCGGCLPKENTKRG